MKNLKVKSEEGIETLRVLGGKAVQIITLRIELYLFACLLGRKNNFSLKIYFIILGNFKFLSVLLIETKQ